MMTAESQALIRRLYDLDADLVCGLADAARTVAKLGAALEVNLATDLELQAMREYDALVDLIVKQDENG